MRGIAGTVENSNSFGKENCRNAVGQLEKSQSEVGKFSLIFLYLSNSSLSLAIYNFQIRLLFYTVFQCRICIIRLQHIYIQKRKLNLILNNIVLSMFLILFVFLYLLLSTVFSILLF